MNLLDILQFAEEYLKKYSFSKSRLESEMLIADVLHLDRLSLYVNYDRMLQEEEKLEIKKYLYQMRSEEHTSELQSRQYLVCRLLLEKKKKINIYPSAYKS